MAKLVKVYTTQFCPHCTRAKRLLESIGVAYEEIDLTSDDAKREEIQERTGWMTVPIIFVGEEFIGGADELFTLESSGELDQKLSKLK